MRKIGRKMGWMKYLPPDIPVHLYFIRWRDFQGVRHHLALDGICDRPERWWKAL
jgi:hypothetical protein